MSILSGNAVWRLILQSDVVSWSVLFILFALSLACWTLFLLKFATLRTQIKKTQELCSLLPHVKTVDELLALHARFAKTIPGYFLIKQLKSAEWYLEGNIASGVQSLLPWQLNQLEGQGFTLIDEIVSDQEQMFTVLSTSAAVSPLLGLFGTVWGLIQAFIAIGEKQSADITAVAPGIAQALTTTLAGLIVAIPAFVMVNQLSQISKQLEQKLVQLSERSQAIIQRLLVRV